MSLAAAFRLFGQGRDSAAPASSWLRAWWQGHASQSLPQAEISAKSSELAESAEETHCPDRESAGSAEDAPDPWSQERLALLAELWGPGFTSPGGSNAVRPA